jgi:membrane protease YdiL (CAAX protease family)
VVLAVLFPIRAGTFGYRRLRQASPADLPRVRLSVYRQAIVLQWSLSAVIVAVWAARHRAWSALGLRLVLTPGLIGAAIGFAVIVVLIVRQRRAALADDDTLEAVAKRMRHIERMLPASEEDLGWFYRLSITAGICEELLYRGYMIWYLSHWLGLIPAIAVAAALFGIGHAYQGVKGILTTGLVGAFLGGVFAITGSLYLPMLMHALMDAHSGHLSFVALRRQRERAMESSPPEHVA